MVCLVVVCGFRRQRYYFFCIYANISDFLFCLLRPITLFIASKSDLDTALPSSLFPSVAFLPPLDSLYCADCQSAFPLPPFPPPLGGRGAFSFPLSSIASELNSDTVLPSSFVHFRAMLSPAPFVFSSCCFFVLLFLRFVGGTLVPLPLSSSFPCCSHCNVIVLLLGYY